MIDCEVNNIKKLEYTRGKVKFRSLECSVDFLHVHTLERGVSRQLVFLHVAILRLGPHPWVKTWTCLRPPLRFRTLSKTQKRTNSLLLGAKCCHTAAATVVLRRVPQKLDYSLSY